jgi:antagonist of KipI
VLEVLEPGLLTTVQDGGRPGLGHLGVPFSGACDRTSLAIANLLIGNQPDDAALELTVAGGRYRVLEPVTVGLAGADLGGLERASGRRLEPGASHVLAAGETIEFTGAEAGRAYLAVPGGVDVPKVLGSRSTCLPGAFGGLQGRALRAGDVIRPAVGHSIPGPADGARWPGSPAPPPSGPIRVLAGPHLHRLGSGALGRLVGTTWIVTAASNRMGLRLTGATIEGAGGELVSHGVPTGAIQVTASGLPIALLADHQVTGGYPIVAVVATVDLPHLGQLVPGGTVRFTEVPLAEARAAQGAVREAFEQAAAALRDADRWDDLWQSSGG